MKILTVVGARPQFVKAAVVSKAIARESGIREVLVHTGQHYDSNLSEVFFQELHIPKPAYNMNIGSGSHGWQTGAMLGKIEEVMCKEEPDWVLVYGDTNSTLAGALAAAKLQIPIAHVEAGLRSFNKRMPEEVNRILTDHVSSLLLAPTVTAVNNLLHEGLSDAAIEMSGDVMYDATIQFADLIRLVPKVLTDLSEYALMTIHRAENTDNFRRFELIVNAMLHVARSIPVVWPIHPRSLHLLKQRGLYEQVASTIRLIEPVGYIEMLKLEKQASVIVTDSGGVQKEAFFQRRPCVTLRDETEWTELVDLGWNHLCPPEDQDQIATTVLASIGTVGKKGSPYGTGNAASRIVAAIKARN